MSYMDYLDFIDEQHEHMKQLVYNWSAINSGSSHIEGLAAMQRVLRDNFLWLQGEMEDIPLTPAKEVNHKGIVVDMPLGQAIRIRKRPEAKLQVFLCGHYDTVFGKDHPFQKPVLVDNNTINGPGVADLKGGLVVMLKALEAFERTPFAESLGWEILLNPDEEIGSPGSDTLLKEAAARNHIGLIYEPSLPDGTIVAGRKGSGNFTLIAHGKAAHAGREHHLGRNAIVRLAEATLLIDALNGKREGVTVNAGIVQGGAALNVVPDIALMRFNIRVGNAEDQAWVQSRINRIVQEMSQRYQPDYSFELHGDFTRPPKIIHERDKALWDGLKSTGDMLGIAIHSKDTGGCCDGNNLAAYGLSNIDTLGVRGGNIHSDKEYILLDSLAERAKLSALLLMRIANGDITLT